MAPRGRSRPGVFPEISLNKASQDKAWRDFYDWCRSRGLKALPAHPWTVAYYARWSEKRLRHAAIVKCIKAISRVHLLNCYKPPDRHPVVVRTLHLLEQRPQAKRHGAALFRAEDFIESQNEAKKHSKIKEGDAAQPTKRLPPKKRAARKEGSLRRTMRATPKLVSRRPT